MRRVCLFLPTALFALISPVLADVIEPIDPSNVPPPAGALLDLAGTPIQPGWTQYSASFVAAGTSTDITFLFRNDPGFTAIDDVSATTGGGPNLLLNGGFELGTVGSSPVDWNYDNGYGAPYGGTVTSASSAGGCGAISPYPFDGSNAWCDGATQAYDAIDQTIATTVGQTYTISFYQAQVDANSISETGYQQLSTNGDTTTGNADDGTDGNGVDTLVYVGSTIPTPVPEPSSAPFLLTSVAVGLGALLRRKLAR